MSGPGAGGSTQTQPQLPASLAPIFFPSVSEWANAQKAASAQGGVSSLLDPHPESIAPLTPSELTNIGQLESFAQTGAPGEQQAMKVLAGLTSGPIGSSPDTQAAMRAFDQNVMPTIDSSIAATGGGRGGEIAAARSQADVSAYAPLAQQEVQNRLASVPLYQQLAQQRSGDVSTALQAADLPRQIQQQTFSSRFQDFLRRAGLIQNLELGPASTLGPGLLGSTSISTPGKFVG